MKRILVLFVVLSMMFSLIACGGGDEGGKKNNNNGDASSQWEHLDWSKGADASDGDVTLRVTSWRQYDKAYYEEIERRFEEKYDWIDVQIDITASQSAYYSNIQADILDGAAPDVMDLHGNYLVDYAKEGVLAPQSDFAYMDNYKDIAKEYTTINGEVYGFMVAYNYFGFIYNADIFNQYGITAPKTPEEMVAVVNQLKDKGYGGVAYPGATIGSKVGKNILEICLGPEGVPELYGGIDNGTITDISTIDGVEDAFKTMEYYVDNEIFYDAFEGISYESVVSLFAQKKTAIMYNGTYALGEAQQTFPDINFGYFAIPTYSAKSMNTSESAQNACISANCENLGAAKLWVEFLATPEISSYFCSNSKMLSSIEGVTLDNEVSNMILNSSESFVLPLLSYENDSYWSMTYEAVFDNVIFAKNDWKEEVSILTRRLEEYDLSNL